MRKFRETGRCSLCRGEYAHWGNNPEPVARYQDRCCDDCNWTRVIPTRILLAQLGLEPRGEAHDGDANYRCYQEAKIEAKAMGRSGA